MKSRLRALLPGGALGAALMYLADPERGARRRALLRDRALAGGRRLGDAAGVTRRDLGNRTRGLLAELRGRLRREQPTDLTVQARVRARLGRVVLHPRAIGVAVNDGQVTLSGPILAHEVDRLLATVARTRGVKGIDNQLETQQQPGGTPALQGSGSLPTNARWSPTRRLVVGAGGGALTLAGLRRRRLSGTALGLAGTGLLTRAATNLEARRLLGVGAGRRAVDVRKTINVDAPLDEVFKFWANFENFPIFMEHVQEIRDHGNGRSHWIVTGPAGTTATWNATITRFKPNRLIAWRSLPDSMIPNTGRVRFDRNPDGSTRVQARLSYNPPAGALGHAVATLLGSDPRSQMDADLLRFKSLIETGKTTADDFTATRAEVESQMPPMETGAESASPGD